MSPKRPLAGRADLARRYHFLWTGEAAAIILFSFLFVYYTRPGGHWSEWIVGTYGLAVCVAILVQGTVWWLYRLRLLRAGARGVQEPVANRFRRCKWLNWGLIGAFPLILVAKASVTGSIWSSSDTWWGFGFMAGALLEQVNYYYYQLMYDRRSDRARLRTERRLRRGPIGRYIAS